MAAALLETRPCSEPQLLWPEQLLFVGPTTVGLMPEAEKLPEDKFELPVSLLLGEVQPG